ncbi:dynamin family protein [Thiothrix winogradskyi]|uniref:Dynamin family protein n=1 Tax=Thiothrix winogradskyi TaxID=96472 RepID=A0ABY3SXB7_9GAMM|nr:dynamin family protein [Thiothrix winogradskyi]UJS24073.1 dynamin family protein [Thiothrix winogradskyi]
MHILNQTLEQREARIGKVLDYIRQTQHIFEKYASSELKAAHGRFEPLIQGLESDKVRIVVIGEFSRGKSRLVNALLGIDLLPSAKEATTAINTFLQSPPVGRENDKYIRLNFIDKERPDQELNWDNDGVLKQWGTELDKNNKSARSQLQRIDVFAAHDLLNKGLVIIDTPGLESVVAHHEEITRKAIAGAHIAIWVQSVEQLGGNSREWQFLTATVRQNFRKFLTVVNMWDQVLEPEDDHDKAKPESERVDEKLNTVRENFRQHLKGLSESELAQMTNDQHLMGVSAKWALSKDDEQKRRSGIDHLVQRIADLCNSGEAQQEVFYKPLKQLSHIQTTLAAALDDEINVLNDSRTLDEKKRELDLLEQEIKSQTLEKKQAEREHKDEHHRVAQVMTKEINENLVQPLRGLRDEINIILTENYIRHEVEAGHKNIGLPQEAQIKFQQVTQTVSEKWVQQKQQVELALNNLKAEYVSAMEKRNIRLKKTLGSMNIELPEIKIDLKLDLSNVISFQKKKIELEHHMEKLETEMEKYEVESAQLSHDDPRIKSAQFAYEMAQRQLRDLGSQPEPYAYQVREQVVEPGIWDDAKYEQRTQYDDSNLKEYQAERAQLKNDMHNRGKLLEKLMQEEAERSKQRQTAEVMRRKAEQQLAKIEKQRKEKEASIVKEQQAIVADTLRALQNSTMGELNNRIGFLEKNVSKSIEKLFDDQLDVLLACVEEQFMQPLRAKQAKREEVLEIFKREQDEIEQRKLELSKAKKQLSEVMDFTQTALAN